MLAKFMEWKAMVELQLGCVLQEFQSDNGCYGMIKSKYANQDYN